MGESGRKWEKVYIFTLILIGITSCMLQLIGEFDCKLDAKGRLVVPSALKRQLPNVEQDGLIVNRGFEKNLVIYTREEWDKQAAKIARLNTFTAKNRAFIRQFMRGATMLTLDAAGRVLLPKVLLDYAGISGEIVLACQFDRIEVWAKSAYEEMMNDGADMDFSTLAEEVMGDFDFGGEGDE